MIKLALIDVDGTLHGAGGVHPRVWDAADRARARGLHLGICTGRSGVGAALDYAKRLDPGGLHIFDSGAVILGGDGAVHRAASLPQPLCALVLSLALAEDLELDASHNFFPDPGCLLLIYLILTLSIKQKKYPKRKTHKNRMNSNGF